MKLDVEFLSNYIIKYDDDHWIDFNLINSHKLAKLLAYIIYNHRRKLNSGDLQTLMFASGESNNPANALKALIYRLRNILKKYLGEHDYILSSKGTYYWNPDIKLFLDVDDFNKYYRLGRNEMQSDEIRADYYYQAYQMYHGQFLPMIEDVEKLQIIRSYLNSQYLNAVHFLIEYYLDRKEYNLVEEICLEALNDNHLDENINLVLILTLVKQDKLTLAKKRYNEITTTLKDVFSNYTISKMRYYLNLNNKNNEEKNILAIQNDLIEDKTHGAYFCDYDFFKKSYQLEARKSVRSENGRTLVVLTINPKDYVKDNLEICNMVLEATSKMLENVLLKLLRLGDIVCKYSTKQFLILLDCSKNDTINAIDRIKKDFSIQDKYNRVDIEYSFAALAMAKVQIDDKDIIKIE